MRAPFSVRMHFSKLALRTRKGQPTTWPRRGGGRKKRFVAPFLTSYWSLRCSAGVRPSTHLHSVRHLPRPPSRSLVQMHDGPKQFDPCCKARRHPHGIGLLTITAMTAVIAGDLHGECGPRGVGNRGTTDCESDHARGDGCSCGVGMDDATIQHLRSQSVRTRSKHDRSELSAETNARRSGKNAETLTSPKSRLAVEKWQSKSLEFISSLLR